ncbi:hypothetical protein RJT34_11619 [Clitoria ternatea]|uniref:Uncharacterized protein n=1 Tax=Clitoria ternatea TaxID=43366 RepID=A0AAN9PK78_CLITE
MHLLNLNSRQRIFPTKEPYIRQGYQSPAPASTLTHPSTPTHHHPFINRPRETRKHPATHRTTKTHAALTFLKSEDIEREREKTLTRLKFRRAKIKWKKRSERYEEMLDD